jgi:hypothetical protein
MIKFHCNLCDKKIGVPDNYAGKRVKCPQCHQAVLVPEPEENQIVPELALNDAALSADLLARVESDIVSSPPPTISGGSKASSRTADTPAVKCLKCGAAVNPDSEFCIACGQPRPVTAAPQEKPSAPVAAAKAVATLPLILAGGLGGAIVGATLWAGVAALTKYEIGWGAWGIGALAGFGLTLFTTRRGVGMGLLAALFAIVGILVGKALIAQWVIMPIIEKEIKNFQLSDDQIQEMVNDPAKMFSVACLHLVDQGEFDEPFAWKVIGVHNKGESYPAEQKKIDEAQKKASDLVDSWSDAEKLAAAKAQSHKFVAKFTNLMKQTKAGFAFAFIASFSLIDILWFLLAVASAYKIATRS